MANVDLPIFPSNINCLAWSLDGDLAIAAGDFVYILIPNRPEVGNATQRINHHPAVGPWHHVRFRVNTFGIDEWPYQEPASLDDLSLGEEQSTSIVTALAWSAPGLALHGRCVLAVSTSNQLVSLWEAQHKPAESSNWYRSCILNHALENHSPNGKDQKPSKRRQSRIKAVTWSRKPPEVCGGWKELHLLAVVNQDGDLYFLRLNRTKIPRSRAAQVVLFLPAKHHPQPQDRRVEALKEAKPRRGKRTVLTTQRVKAREETRRVRLERNHIGYSLAWSDWHNNNKTLRSVLVYKHAGLEMHQQIACSYPKITEQGNGFYYGHLTLTQHGGTFVQRSVADGPSIWTPKGDGSFYHCVGGGRQIVDLSSYHVSDATDLMRTPTYGKGSSCTTITNGPDRWSVDERVKDFPPTRHSWEQISGICAVRSADNQALIVCLATHLSVFKRYRVNDGFPPISHPDRRRGLFLDDRASELGRKMDQCRREFAKAKKLGSQTTMKTWGLASHGPLLASIVSLHPSEMVEYTTAAQEKSTVLFSNASLEDISFDSGASFHDEPVVRRIPLDGNGKKEKAKEISFPWERAPVIPLRHLAQRSFLQKLSFEPYVRTGLDVVSAIASFNLVCVRFVHDGDAGRFLAGLEPGLRHPDYRDVVAELARCRTFPSTEPSLGIKMINAIIRVAGRHAPELRTIPMEECICGPALEWEITGAAACVNGHRWRRCALSYLAILQPGISKYCETCRAEYLDDGQFPPPADRADVGIRDEIRCEDRFVVPCDVRDLFRLEPACFLCRGKFVIDV